MEQLNANGQQTDQQVNEDENNGVSVEAVVETLRNDTVNSVIDAKVNQQVPQATQSPQVGNIDLGKYETMMSGLMDEVKSLRSIVEKTNEETVDNSVHNATINMNEDDKTFEIDKTSTTEFDDKFKALTDEMNKLKTETVKQTYGLTDADFKFVSDVASSVNINILEDNDGLKSIINAIEKNNKVVIGKQRQETVKSSTEQQMAQTANYLSQITNGKL